MRSDSLWGHRDFRLLWAGDTVGQFGTFVSHTALPLLAVTALAATPTQMGLLTMAEYAAFLLLGLPAGVWVDRLRRGPLMIRASLVRGALLLTVPLCWWAGLLTFTQLVVVALLAGAGTLLFDIAYQSYLPSLVGRAKLTEGNAKLQASQSVAQVSGPGIGGGLAQLAGAANAVLLTGLGYVVTALVLRRIGTAEPAPVRRRDTSLRAEVAEGLRFVFTNRTLRAITACTATANLAGGGLVAVQVLFLTRELGLAPGLVGLVLAAEGAGGVAGALTASRWLRRVGHARAIWLVPLLTWPTAVLFPLAEPGWLVVLAVAGLAVHSHGAIVYNVAQVSYRQAICPDHLLGRMNASVRFVVWGALPIGGLTGGLLGEWLGLRGAVWVCVAGMVLGVGWVLASPLRSLRDLPVTPEPATSSSR